MHRRTLLIAAGGTALSSLGKSVPGAAAASETSYE